jgi:hypothetical protein
MFTLPNDQIDTQIYQIANGVVYRGMKKKDNQPVILKVLKEDYPTPEELTHRALDSRSDFYSLGATFYELFTGKRPFESKDAMELVHCHIAKTPVPVCEVTWLFHQRQI